MLVLVLVLVIVPWSGPATAADDTAQAERAALRAALAPHAWMSRQADWPCHYGARLEQRRIVGERALRSQGRLYQDCERGLVWLVERPLPGTQVYARNGNFLAVDRRGAPRALDGLAERRIGHLLQDLFIGDIDALHRDFSHRPDPDDPSALRLIPRDAQMAARLDAIVISGDAAQTTIQVRTAGQASAPAQTLGLRLFGFDALADDDSADRCERWLGADDPAQRERAEQACDVLARPGRWLERARSGSR